MDCFCVCEPWNLQLIHQDIGYTAITTGELWNKHPEKSFGLRAAWVDKNPKAAKALLMAVMEAQQWCEKPDNRDEVAAICAKRQWINCPVDDVTDRVKGKFDYGIPGKVVENSPHIMPAPSSASVSSRSVSGESSTTRATSRFLGSMIIAVQRLQGRHARAKSESFGVESQEITRPFAARPIALPEPDVEIRLVGRLIRRKANVAVDGEDRAADFWLGVDAFTQLRQARTYGNHELARGVHVVGLIGVVVGLEPVPIVVEPQLL